MPMQMNQQKKGGERRWKLVLGEEKEEEKEVTEEKTQGGGQEAEQEVYSQRSLLMKRPRALEPKGEEKKGKRREFDSQQL